jgi:hypothetical protein
MAKKIENNLDRLFGDEGSKTYDPYQVIGDVFSAASLEHYQKYISSMMKAAYSEDYWKKSAPGNLLSFQEQILELIKAVYLIVKKGKGGVKRKSKAILNNSVFENGIEPTSYYGWHIESAIWEFFPRNLDKAEFLNPYKAFERFFEYKKIQTWLKEFKELVSFALEAFGNETGIDYDYLEMHRQLQKLVEASHLIEVRVIKPTHLKPKIDTPTDKPVSNNNNEAKSGCNELENYSNDPYMIISQFFLDGEVQDGRDDLNRLFEAAFPDDLIVKKHYPSQLVFAYERVDRLIDAAHTLNQEVEKGKDMQEAKLDAKVLDRAKVLYEKVKDWNQFPYKLRPVEWVKPRMAIRAFFNHQPLSHWKGKLHELLQASIRNESFCSTISDRSKLYMDCEHLGRLIEAMWVIMVMEIR